MNAAHFTAIRHRRSFSRSALRCVDRCEYEANCTKLFLPGFLADRVLTDDDGEQRLNERHVPAATLRACQEWLHEKGFATMNKGCSLTTAEMLRAEGLKEFRGKGAAALLAPTTAANTTAAPAASVAGAPNATSTEKPRRPSPEAPSSAAGAKEEATGEATGETVAEAEQRVMDLTRALKNATATLRAARQRERGV